MSLWKQYLLKRQQIGQVALDSCPQDMPMEVPDGVITPQTALTALRRISFPKCETRKNVMPKDMTTTKAFVLGHHQE